VRLFDRNNKMVKEARPLLVAIAFAAFVSLGLPDAILGVAWPSIRQTFGLSLSRLGEVLATSMVGYLLSSALSGSIVRRAGVGRLLLGSSVLVTLSLAIYASAPAWWVMVACGLLGGLGAGAIDAGINAYAADRFPPRLVTWLHACYGVGATLGPLAMTAVLTGGLEWRWGYGLVGAVLALMSILFLVTRRLWTAGPSESSGGEEPATATAGQTLRLPLAWVHIALFFLYTGLEVTAGQWLYSLLTESRGIAPALAGVSVGLYWGGLTAGRVVFGIAANRFRRGALLRFATVSAPVAALALWWGPAPGITVAAATLLGFVLAPIYPLLISATPGRLGREYAAHAIGFQVSAAYLGAAALAGAAGIFAKAYGLEVLGPFLVGASLCLLLLHEVALRMPRPSGAERGPAPA
jgi:fucose permease